MKRCNLLPRIIGLSWVMLFLVACNTSTTVPTLVPPSPTAILPTLTPFPSMPTAIPPTLTLVPVGDLETVVSVFLSKDVTTLQKSQLIGRQYSGLVKVADVELVGPDNKKTADISVDVGYNGHYVKMSFNTADVDKASQLRKGSQIRVTGKLFYTYVKDSGYFNRADTEWIVFQEVTID